ncbi:MAG: S8 family serine peptidase [Blastocatellia bacterium]|nr:S8 family serine peptidase [Blastocatellia bacterium]
MPESSNATESHEHGHAQNRFAVIPTPQRLGVSSRYAGRGVVIAILDSGFYPHPDLTEPRNRILAFTDVTGERDSLESDREPAASDWHGTQTSVVAAGNGHLSDGVYRGLASEAAVVLVKVGEAGRITDEDIVRGLEWVVKNRHVYGIRIVSMSLGGDEDLSFRESLVDQAAERAVNAGLVVVVAAGNAGCGERPRPIPPANSPSVITVGGADDGNLLENAAPELYCSNYGFTVDGIVKPEVLAPAIWVAAPILPRTDLYRRAEALSELMATPDYLLRDSARRVKRAAGLPDELDAMSVEEIRVAAETRIREQKIVATHYQHVDGTSFAAPVVAAVIAQMLEANPALTPRVIRNLLISTADRLAGQPLLRQGYGMLNAARAIEAAARESHTDADHDFTPPQVENGALVFRFHHDQARSVSLAGDFNQWRPDASSFHKQSNGIWRAQIKMLPPGQYQYKFVIDEERWIDDPGNGMKSPDGHGGFNSILQIA